MKIFAPMKYVAGVFFVSLLLFLLVIYTCESDSIFITITLVILAFVSCVFLIGYSLVLLTAIPGVLCSPFMYIHLRRRIASYREIEIEAQENHERLLKQLARLEKASNKKGRT